jgi:hypothetical protein
MHIEDRLTAIEEKLESILQALQGQGAETESEPEPEPAPAKRGRPAAKAAAEPAPAPASKGKKAKPAPSVTIDDLRAECVKLAKADDEGKEKIVAALQRHGAERLGELDESRYAEFLDMLKKISDEAFDPREGSGEDDEDF